eukprot:gene53570-38082_t
MTFVDYGSGPHGRQKDVFRCGRCALFTQLGAVDLDAFQRGSDAALRQLRSRVAARERD